MLISRALKVLAPGTVPFMFAAIFTIFTVVYRIIDLPQPTEIANTGRELYDSYGGITLFLAALVEGVFMVNIYFPGSFVIVLAVFLSDKSIIELSYIAGITWLAFVIAGQFNYWLGNKGFYKLLMYMGNKDVVANMQAWMQEKGKYAVTLAAIHPNFLAVSQVCMGISGGGVLRNLRLTALSLAVWVPLWTVVFSIIISRIDLTNPNQSWYVVALFIMWGFILVAKQSISLLKKKPLTRP